MHQVTFRERPELVYRIKEVREGDEAVVTNLRLSEKEARENRGASFETDFGGDIRVVGHAGSWEDLEGRAEAGAASFKMEPQFSIEVRDAEKDALAKTALGLLRCVRRGDLGDYSALMDEVFDLEAALTDAGYLDDAAYELLRDSYTEPSENETAAILLQLLGRAVGKQIVTREQVLHAIGERVGAD